MNITVTGSLGNISKPLTETLVKAGHNVTLITSKADNADAIKALGATPAIGLVTDVDFLTRAFTGADALYIMTPPNREATEWKNYIGGIGKNYAAAVAASGVKKVVHLSSLGAHLEDGTGPIAGIHRVEEALNALEGVAVKHLRPGYFFTNYYANVDMIKHGGILGSNYSADTQVVLVDTADIADAAAEELQSDFTGKSVRYVASDVLSGKEIAATLGAAIGKPELPWVEFSDADALNGMVQAGLSEEIASNYVEMGQAIRTGVLNEDYLIHQPALSKRKLKDFAVEFAKAF